MFGRKRKNKHTEQVNPEPQKNYYENEILNSLLLTPADFKLPNLEKFAQEKEGIWDKFLKSTTPDLYNGDFSDAIIEKRKNLDLEELETAFIKSEYTIQNILSNMTSAISTLESRKVQYENSKVQLEAELLEVNARLGDEIYV